MKIFYDRLRSFSASAFPKVNANPWGSTIIGAAMREDVAVADYPLFSNVACRYRRAKARGHSEISGHAGKADDGIH